MASSQPRSALPPGLAEALAAYLTWGVVPAFFKLLADVSPFEIVAERICWSVPLLLAILAVRGRLGEVRSAFGDPNTRWRLLLSAALIGVNWLVYIAAVNGGHILAASLGYYLNPLINVALGVAVLKERMSRAQGIAIALAAAGVSLLLFRALDTLWISMTLAISFALYGLVRKLTPVRPMPGLTVETLVLLPLALAAALWFLAGDPRPGFGSDWRLSLLLVASGPVTALPLMWFGGAARKMPLATLGFVQFLSPTIVFFLGVFAYGEPLRAVQLACFVLIWSAVALFTLDMVRKARTPEPA